MPDAVSPHTGGARLSSPADDRFASFLDVPAALLIQDAHGTIVFANPAAQALLGADAGRVWQDEHGAPVDLCDLPGCRLLRAMDAPERLVRISHGGGADWVSVAGQALRATHPPLAVNVLRDANAAVKAQEEVRLGRALHQVALALASELDAERLVQLITDQATAICGAQFGAFFHNVERPEGGRYVLYTLSGAPREAFDSFGHPRATPVFAPTFRGEGPVRSGDIRADARYGQMPPHHGMPAGHLPVVSYLAVPVLASSGEVLGGLFFGHAAPDRFSEAHERAVVAIAAHAAIALEKARLFARARANEARLASERARLVELVQQAPLAMAVLRGPRHVYELANEHYLRLTGRGRELIGRPIAEVFPEAAGQGVFEACDQVYRDGQPFVVDEMPVTFDRGRGAPEEGWFAFSITPMREEGVVAGLICVAAEVTAQVRARRDLEALTRAVARSERRFRSLVEATSQMVWTTTAAGEVKEDSSSWRSFTGQSYAEWVGYGWLDAVHPEDRAKAERAWREAVAQKTKYEVDYRVRTADGGWAHTIARGTPILSEHGEIEEWIGLNINITDRVRATEALRENERRLGEARNALRIQKMLEGISDAFAVYDSNWTVIFVNRASALSLGREPRDVIGRTLWELVPAAVDSKLHHDLARVLETGETVTFEQFYAPLGRWFEVHAYPVADVGVAVYARDVTARRQAQALQERLARYGELRAEIGTALSVRHELGDMLQACCQALVLRLEVALAGIWLLGGDNVLTLNGRAGLASAAAAAHERIPVGSLMVGRVAEHRQPHLSNDLPHDPAVGDRRWIEEQGLTAFAGYPLVVGDRLVGVMAVFAKAALPEDTLVALGSIGDAIGQGVERRRAELSLAEHARDLARSNADLEQFAYVASHDLQEPLRMVASYVQLLERRYRDRLDQDAREFIGYAVEGVTRMRKLIEDLLAYSRVGTRGREATPTALSRVVAAAEKNLERAMIEARALITMDPLPEVSADEGQLIQLFQNLIGNALKFRRDVPVRVHISAQRDGSDWVISVRDNGIGIDSQYFERIFVIFQRLNPRELYPGTGIGLAIAKKIVERHGGRIWVESTPGEGSTLFFTLPAASRLRAPSTPAS